MSKPMASCSRFWCVRFPTGKRTTTNWLRVPAVTGRRRQRVGTQSRPALSRSPTPKPLNFSVLSYLVLGCPCPGCKPRASFRLSAFFIESLSVVHLPYRRRTRQSKIEDGCSCFFSGCRWQPPPCGLLSQQLKKGGVLD